MPYILNKYEKETVILYNQSNDRVNITTYDPVLRRKLTDYAAKHPDLCKRLDKGKYPDYVEYEIDKDRLSVRFLTPYSEERRKAAAEQAKRLNQRGCIWGCGSPVHRKDCHAQYCSTRISSNSTCCPVFLSPMLMDGHPNFCGRHRECHECKACYPSGE